MKYKKLLAGAVLLAMLGVSLPAFAQTEAVLKLPAGLEIIGAEAFLGNAAIRRVEVSNGTAEIGARAFADSGLKEISLPASVKSIAEDAFEGCENLLIEAVTGSYALEWALEKGYAVLETANPEPTPDPTQGGDELPWVPAMAN